MNLAEKVRLAGVVGAGGGGFPAHVKLAARAEYIIANGAECEPLLHKDAVVMERNAAALVEGMELSMEAVGASHGVIGIKAKKKHAVEAVQEACKGTRVTVKLLGDYYPAGDEYDLVYEVTGRLIPPGGIPINVGAIVNNVETLVNIAAASRGQAVTHKTVTIAGAVNSPQTFTVPVGTTFREAIQIAGGASCPDPVLCIGGLMMGVTTDKLDTPIIKTSTGVVVLDRTHHVVARKLTPTKVMAGIGKSACDQCRYCTEYCPRFLLGYAVEPHQVMRSLGFTATGSAYWNQWASLCCSCGLCTLFACPEELFPKEACDSSKAEMRAANVKWTGPMDIKPHPMREGRRVPIKSLMRRMDIEDYDHPAPYRELPAAPARLVVPLKQGAGVGNEALVKTGDRVDQGQVLGKIPEGKMGALVHAPCRGRVENVTLDHVIIVRES